jgi:hypothetical protein
VQKQLADHASVLGVGGEAMRFTTSAVFNRGQLAAKARAISALSQAEEIGGLGIGPSMGLTASFGDSVRSVLPISTLRAQIRNRCHVQP